MNVVALGTAEKHKLKDSDGDSRMIHSLDSLSFLKLESSNFINFKFQSFCNRVISIEQEYSELSTKSKHGKNTCYQDIYCIKVD